jgi:hypothetical protein
MTVPHERRLIGVDPSDPMALGYGAVGITQRRTPRRQLPKAPDVIGRDRECELIAAKLVNGSVALFGEVGIGKSWLVAVMANKPDTWSELGYIHLACAANQRWDEVAGLIAQQFFAFAADTVVADNDSFRPKMATVSASIVLDDADLGTDALTRLCEFAPRSRFLVAATKAQDMPGAYGMPLAGLSLPFAVKLMESKAPHHGAAMDATAIAGLHKALRGNPKRLALAATVFENQREFPSEAELRVPSDVLANPRYLTLTDLQRAVLATLVLLNGGHVYDDLLAQIVGAEVAEVRLALLYLREYGLVESHSPIWNLAVPIDWVAAAVADHRLATNGLAETLAAWVRGCRANPSCPTRLRQWADAPELFVVRA